MGSAGCAMQHLQCAMRHFSLSNDMQSAAVTVNDTRTQHPEGHGSLSRVLQAVVELCKQLQLVYQHL
jgi:hypothetical protein